MSAFFNTVHITNFKSLKDVTLSDCKRINLLIGKPNVGKSNILEAIGLFGLPYLHYYFPNNPKDKDLTLLIRSENIGELFFDGNIDDFISINANTSLSYTIEHQKQYNRTLLTIGGKGFGFDSRGIFSDSEGSEKDNLYIECDISNELKITSQKNKKSGNYFDFSEVSPTIKYYKFSHSAFKEDGQNRRLLYDYLIPPFGINFVEVFRKNANLKNELTDLFKQYDLKFLFDKGTNSLRIVKETQDGEIFSIPYSSIADTLQRVVFFKTAIASNKDSIILFEEPEAHCFPPYIRHITQEIIESESNQFFIATHSPYVLNDFLEYQRDDVAIFIADFKDGQTVIKRLTDSEVNDVYGYGIDLFFNSELFTDEI
jgi:AAA15 family ATPase/GTPase